MFDAVDPDRLRELARSANALIRRSLAHHEHLPQDVVDLLSADEDFPVRILLCENQPTVAPAVLVDTAERTSSVAALSMIRRNPSYPRDPVPARTPIPPAELLALVDDPDNPDDRGATRAASEPGLPVTLMHTLLDRAGVPRLPTDGATD